MACASSSLPVHLLSPGTTAVTLPPSPFLSLQPAALWDCPLLTSSQAFVRGSEAAIESRVRGTPGWGLLSPSSPGASCSSQGFLGFSSFFSNLSSPLHPPAVHALGIMSLQQQPGSGGGRVKGAGEREADAWSGQVGASSTDRDLDALLMGVLGKRSIRLAPEPSLVLCLYL